MALITILAIALGLAMDALTVSITSGMTIKNLKSRNALRIGLFFGSFQAVMPLIGWTLGLSVRDLIADFDHWIAFGLLAFVGGKMIREALHERVGDRECNPLDALTLHLLAIATSIDALAVGLSLSFLQVSIILPVIVIGLVTFSLSFLGVFAGNRFTHIGDFGPRLEVLGGLILIGIGIKIVLEHLGV